MAELEFEPRTVKDSPVRHLTTRTHVLTTIPDGLSWFLKAKRRPEKSSTWFAVSNRCYYFGGLNLVFESLGLWGMQSIQLWSCSLSHQHRPAELECSGDKTVAVSRDEVEDWTWTVSLNTISLLLIPSGKGALVCHWRLIFMLRSALPCHEKHSWPFSEVFSSWGTEWYQKTLGTFSKRTTVALCVWKQLSGSLCGSSPLTLQPHFTLVTKRVEVFPHQAILCYTSWVSYDFTQFWYHPPRDSADPTG